MTHTVKLTTQELNAVRACISSELDNDDGMTPNYFNPLRRAAKKLTAARKPVAA